MSEATNNNSNNGSSNDNGNTETSTSAVDPDPDTIKMFVGQIPRAWNEEDCKKFFEEFGSVHSLNVLRDRSNNVSKGCCFVTFFHRKDALSAQNTLHNVRVLPGMHHAMQVKPADVENQRKLFIGMLGKNMSESDVKAVFQEFGQIEDCTVLRDPDGKSRGCGFLTFVTRNCAQLAIRKMHQAKTFEGCTKPVVVKFADTPKDKENKKSALAQALGGAGGGASALSRLLGAPAVGASANPTAALLAQLLQPQPQAQSATNQLLSGLQALLPLLTAAQQPQPQQHQQPSSSHRSQQQSSYGSQQMNELLQQQKLMELLNKSSGNSAKNDTNAQLAQLLLSSQNGSSASGSVSPPRYNPEPDYFQQQQQPQPAQQQQSLQSTLLTQLQAFAQMGGAGASSSSANSLSATLQAALAGASSSSQATDYASLLASGGGGGGYGLGMPTNGQSKGPDGCNLFIYHLPQDFTDHELNALFALFGNVLSAKVFIDKQTNMSKCFGFVSYDNAASAQKAISGMNGFQIGSKRLKVQMKRGKEKPYQRQAGGGGASPSRASTSPPANNIFNSLLGSQKYAYDE